MADGWLFRLSATLGARQSVPSWPTAPAGAPATSAVSAPALRTGAPERPEPTESMSDDRASD